MGSPDSDQDSSPREKPQHQVQITRPFYLGVTEVTQGQYRVVTGDNPSLLKGSDDLPVGNVSWNEAIAFCNKLSEREGLKPFYPNGAEVQSGGSGYRLPTEAEWEYACRAGSTARYGFDDSPARLGEFAWHGGNSGRRIHPVGQKLANDWGLFDMRGNVAEWCWDWYDESYYAQSPAVDPIGPSQQVARVFRGPGCNAKPPSYRAANRNGHEPVDRFWYLGFRVARNLAGP